METILGLLILPWGIILRGFVLVKMWAWFVIPQFHAEPLRIPIALGLSTLATLATASIDTAKDPDYAKAPMWLKCIVCILIYTMILGIGWIIHLFV